MTTDGRKPLGRILLERQAVSARDLEDALLAQKRGGPPLGSALVDRGAVGANEALRALAEQLGVPGLDLGQVCLDLAALDILPREIVESHRILPIADRGDTFLMAMVEPNNTKILDEIEFVTGKRLVVYVALHGQLERTLHDAYELRAAGKKYFVAPGATPAVARWLGFEPAVLGMPAAPPEAPMELSPVVSDDRTERAAARDEVSEAGEEAVAPSEPRELSEVSRPPTRDGARRTVLIVDDEADVRRMLAKLLGGRGLHVVEADRGMTALKLVKERTPDIVLLDAMLPEVHGFDIAKRLRGSRRYGHIPIVMMSAQYRGWRYAEDIKASYGVAEYVEKPFKIAEMLAVIDRVLAKLDGKGAAPGKDDADGTESLSAEAEKALADGISAYRGGDIDAAIRFLRGGVAIDPLAWRLHFHLGLLLGKRGDTFDAIGALESALESHPKHFPALKNLAVLYQKSGFRNKAIETWERALGQAPDDETRENIKKHLVGLL